MVQCSVGSVAQWSEQGTHNALVAGSNPARPTTSGSGKLRRLFSELPAVDGEFPSGSNGLSPLRPQRFRNIS
jgi:hypothetical protein